MAQGETGQVRRHVASAAAAVARGAGGVSEVRVAPPARRRSALARLPLPPHGVTRRCETPVRTGAARKDLRCNGGWLSRSAIKAVPLDRAVYADTAGGVEGGQRMPPRAGSNRRAAPRTLQTHNIRRLKTRTALRRGEKSLLKAHERR